MGGEGLNDSAENNNAAGKMGRGIRQYGILIYAVSKQPRSSVHLGYCRLYNLGLIH